MKVIDGQIILTSIDEVLSWGRKNSLWPITFGIACCAIEMMAVGMPRFDIDRFGAGVFRPSARQADLMIIAGTVTAKMAPRIIRLYQQMPQPKYVISMGSCANAGGPYINCGYHVVKGVDKIIPVDIYAQGCPPRPENLLNAIFELQKKIKKEAILKQKYGK